MAHTPCGSADDPVFNLTMVMKTCCFVGFYKLESTPSLFASQNTFADPFIVLSTLEYLMQYCRFLVFCLCLQTLIYILCFQFAIMELLMAKCLPNN